MVLIFQLEVFCFTAEANEFAADVLGIEYLKKANRDPGALSIILEKLAGQELLVARRQDPFLRTHPLSKERLKFVNRHKLNQLIVETEKDKVMYKRLSKDRCLYSSLLVRPYS